MDATLALHSAQGISATTWEDIAQESGVSVATVYRHFPSLNELAPACGERVYAMARPPTSAIFSGVRSRRQRIERFVADWFACYERAGLWIINMYRERLLEDDLAHLIAHRESLAREAVADDPRGQQAVWLTVAMTDFWVWKCLTNQGMSTEVAAKIVSDTVSAALSKRRLSSPPAPRRSTEGR